MTKTTSILKVAFRAMGRNKMRSLLTALGIIIGVACVVATIGIGEGARVQAESQLQSLGTNFLMIFPGTTTSSGARSGWGSNSKLSEQDVDAIRQEVASVSYVSASIRTVAQVVYGNQNWSTSIQGGEVDWPAIRSWNVAEGQFFTDADNRAAAKVCVLGRTVATTLFGDEDPIGKMIRIKNIPFRVVGVLEPKGGSMMGQDQDDTVIAPYQTVRKKIMGTTAVGMIMTAVATPELVPQAQEEISALLRQRHKINKAAGQEDDFMIRSQTEMLQQAEQQAKTMAILLWSIAGVSLLVGGIGIMNIMLVSVTERTREIGVRMAIGAKGADIRAQFLVEAVVLAVAGGILGIGLGVGIQQAVAKFAGWPVLVSTSSVSLAFLFSALIGVTFGFYPALKASRLDPIEALRYESGVRGARGQLSFTAALRDQAGGPGGRVPPVRQASGRDRSPTKGLRRDSSPIVVSSPCPGRTRRSPGSVRRRVSIEATRSSQEPPGKSVRPTERRKSVSPEKRTGASPSSRKQRLPGVWPGVWRTSREPPPQGTRSPCARVRATGPGASTETPNIRPHLARSPYSGRSPSCIRIGAPVSADSRAEERQWSRCACVWTRATAVSP
jgi:putative ABC transport system permease protein